MALRPETILDGWRGWDAPPSCKPEVLRELSGGRSNRSFLLDAGGGAMVLRINARAQTVPGVERRQEADIWRAASSAGIAPRLIHADAGGKFLVSEYIGSDLPDRPQDDPAIVAKAIELLRRCHRLDIEAPAIDYAAHIQRYWQIIEAEGLDADTALSEQRKPMRRLLKELLDSQSQLALCHHDPVVANFIGSHERLYLVDWEYAARGLAIMDYAALAAEWEIDDVTLTEQTGIDAGSFIRALAIYRYLCDLWGAVAAME